MNTVKAWGRELRFLGEPRVKRLVIGPRLARNEVSRLAGGLREMLHPRDPAGHLGTAGATTRRPIREQILVGCAAGAAV